MADKGGPRRGSSLFSGPGAGMGGPPSQNRPPQQMQSGSGSGGPPSSGGPRRDSVVLQPGGGLGFGIDFDSDYEDSDDEDVPSGQRLPGQNPPHPNGTGQGGPNHRPLVGGFAAAAYEAARAHHYQKQQKQQQPQKPPPPTNRRPQNPY